QRLASILGADEGIQVDAATAEAALAGRAFAERVILAALAAGATLGPLAAEAPATLERLIGIVREEMEIPLGIAVQLIVAGPHPVAVAVASGAVEGQEPKNLLNVQHRFEGFFQLVQRRLGESLAQLDQRRPVLWIVLGFDLEAALVISEI